jgi:Domain of unknown function (DUF3846)
MKNTHTITIIKPDGTRSTVTCNSKTQYAALKTAVGGWIETLPYFNKFEVDGKQKSCVAYCNEEGKLTGLPYNAPARALWLDALKKKDGSLDHIDLTRTRLASNVAIVTKGVE